MKYQLKAVSVFYGLLGLMSLWASMTSWPNFGESSDKYFYVYIGSAAIQLLWGILALLVMYALLKLRQWGRNLAIWLNAFAVVSLSLNLLVLWSTNSSYLNMVGWRYLLAIVILVIVTAVLVRKDARELVS